MGTNQKKLKGNFNPSLKLYARKWSPRYQEKNLLTVSHRLGNESRHTLNQRPPHPVRGTQKNAQKRRQNSFSWVKQLVSPERYNHLVWIQDRKSMRHWHRLPVCRISAHHIHAVTPGWKNASRLQSRTYFIRSVLLQLAIEIQWDADKNLWFIIVNSV